MKYRAEIDGLRALAVVPVILFHAGFELFSGGFVGVDVFFVVSGYLITTILIEDIENKRFSIVNFYERRARRILPALFFVMLVCIPFAGMWMLPSQMKDFSQSLIAVSLFASNILFWRESGYFAAAAEENPLLHTWSLAVEEQYYLLFPIFLFLAWRFGKDRVFWMIVVFAAISLALSEWGWRNEASANFYLAPTRAWELFAGSIAAFIVQKHGVQTNNTLSLVGLAAIVFAIFVYDETIPFPSVFALVPVVGVVLLILYAGSNTVAAKLLGTKVFVGIGLVSYSAYLWHQPLLAFSRIKFGSPSIPFLLALVTLLGIISYLSWRFVERPFRSNVISRVTITKVCFCCFSLFVGIGIFMSWASFSIHPKADIYAATDRNLYKTMKTDECVQWVSLKYSQATDYNVEKCLSNGKMNVLLLGDSHALNFHNILYEQSTDVNVFTYATGGCRLTDFMYPHCDQLYDDFVNFVPQVKTPKIVIYHQAGNQFIGAADGTEMFYDYSKFNDESSVVLTNLVGSVFKELSTLSEDTGVRVIWIGPWVEARTKKVTSFNPNAVMYFSWLNLVISEQSKNYALVEYLPFDSYIGQKFAELQLIDKECLVFQDQNHLSDCGEKKIARLANQQEKLRSEIFAHE